MSVMDGLIYDRNSSDRDRALFLREKGWANMTAAERSEYLTSMKGAYNSSDANRVGEAVVFLMGYLNAVQGVIDAYRAQKGVAPADIFNVGWGPISLTVKTDWTTGDFPTPDEMESYLSNVATVTRAITVTRTLPDDMDFLTFGEANDIERALSNEYDTAQLFTLAKKRLVDMAALSFIYSDEFQSGEV